MVHRIQNRNPGYSDFSTIAANQSLNFQNNASKHITDGATALKAENDLLKENVSEQEIDQSININSDVGAAETLINDQDESLILKNEIEEPKLETNGLKILELKKILQIYLKIISLRRVLRICRALRMKTLKKMNLKYQHF